MQAGVQPPLPVWVSVPGGVERLALCLRPLPDLFCAVSVKTFCFF